MIGHLAVDVDCWLKEELLGWRPARRGVLLASRTTVANQTLVEYWRKYLVIVQHPTLCRLLHSIGSRTDTRANTSYASPADPSTMRFTHGRYAEVTNAWGDRPPLLAL